MSHAERTQEIKAMKRNAEDKGQKPPEWSNSRYCETYLAGQGPTAYNQFVKIWKKKTQKDREDHGLPSEALHRYLDHASKHWKSIIVTKGNLRRAMVLLHEESCLLYTSPSPRD